MSIQPDTWDLADGTWANFVGSWNTQYNGEASSIGGFSVFAPKRAPIYSAPFGLTGLALSAFNRQLLLGATGTAVGETVLELFSATVTIRESFAAIASATATDFRYGVFEGRSYTVEAETEAAFIWGVYVNASFSIESTPLFEPKYQRIGWGQGEDSDGVWEENATVSSSWTKNASVGSSWTENAEVAP